MLHWVHFFAVDSFAHLIRSLSRTQLCRLPSYCLTDNRSHTVTTTKIHSQIPIIMMDNLALDFIKFEVHKKPCKLKRILHFNFNIYIQKCMKTHTQTCTHYHQHTFIATNNRESYLRINYQHQNFYARPLTSIRFIYSFGVHIFILHSFKICGHVDVLPHNISIARCLLFSLRYAILSCIAYIFPRSHTQTHPYITYSPTHAFKSLTICM